MLITAEVNTAYQDRSCADFRHADPRLSTLQCLPGQLFKYLYPLETRRFSGHYSQPQTVVSKGYKTD